MIPAKSLLAGKVGFPAPKKSGVLRTKAKVTQRRKERNTDDTDKTDLRGIVLDAEFWVLGAGVRSEVR
jgi:hypothetical protein